MERGSGADGPVPSSPIPLPIPLLLAVVAAVPPGLRRSTGALPLSPSLSLSASTPPSLPDERIGMLRTTS
eukprot:8005925-Pyramimonas_sp.AAC.1